jgi:excisionase family DNA binding protein
MDVTPTTAPSMIIDSLKRRRGYVSSTESMAMLGVTRQTLWRWVTEGKIPAVRIGTGNKFDPAHVAAWLQERQV